MKNITIVKLAENLKVSRNTVYRVLDGSGRVSPETRKRVLDELNRNGIFRNPKSNDGTIVFDLSQNPYLRKMGMKLLRSFRDRGFHGVVTESGTNREGFLNAVCDAQSLVFCSDPEPDVLRAAKELNPSVFTLSLFGSVESDVLLRGNEAQGAELAARHLAVNGHRNLLICVPRGHRKALARSLYFKTWMNHFAPDCRLRLLSNPSPAELLRRRGGATAVYFTLGSDAQRFFPERPDDLDILCSGNPGEEPHDGETRYFNMDHIEFQFEDLYRLADYFLFNRPAISGLGKFQAQFQYQLKPCGTVRNLAEGKNL